MRSERRRMMTYSTYEPIDYIVSNGNNYIDTGIYGSYEVDCELSVETKIDSIYIFGSRAGISEKSFNILCSVNNYRFDIGNKMNPIGTITGRHVIQKSAYDILFDNKVVLSIDQDSPAFTTPLPLLLFGVNMPDSVRVLYKGVKIYYLKLFDKGALVRHFVPVRRRSDGKIGMLDKVNNRFYLGWTGQGFTGGNE